MTKDQPLVSVIMPCFNSGKTIRNSLNSILSQSYSNYEIIIIDDGSCDNTSNLLKQYTDSRIIFILNKYEKGVAGARRTGIDTAKGEFIAFLDSDDLWYKDKLTAHINFMQTRDVNFTYSDYQIFNDKTKKYKLLKTNESYNYTSLLGGCNIGCLTVVLRRSVQSNFIYEDLPKEDYVFWLKILKSGVVAYRVPGVHAAYQVGLSSLSSDKLKEVSKQFYTLRQTQKIGFIQSIFYMLRYILNGMKKTL